MVVGFYTGCHAGKLVESGSQSTVSVTSTWFWSAMSRVQGISRKFGWKEPKQIGWVWVVTGGKIGNRMQFSSDNLFLSESPPVTAVPPPRGTLLRRIGNLVRPSPERISGCEVKVKSPYYPYLGKMVLLLLFVFCFNCFYRGWWKLVYVEKMEGWNRHVLETFSDFRTFRVCVLTVTLRRLQKRKMQPAAKCC